MMFKTHVSDLAKLVLFPPELLHHPVMDLHHGLCARLRPVAVSS